MGQYHESETKSQPLRKRAFLSRKLKRLRSNFADGTRFVDRLLGFGKEVEHFGLEVGEFDDENFSGGGVTWRSAVGTALGDVPCTPFLVPLDDLLETSDWVFLVVAGAETGPLLTIHDRGLVVFSRSALAGLWFWSSVRKDGRVKKSASVELGCHSVSMLLEFCGV